ncbi:hypothetical protein L6R52_24165 [Myxococcota bacterium]|nr:hypothetical protein [Myxococcota bacterium]
MLSSRVALLALALLAPRTSAAAEPSDDPEDGTTRTPATLLDLGRTRAELAGLSELDGTSRAGALTASALRAIEASYVDPSRALPESLLVGALSALAAVLPELRIDRTGTARYDARVGRAHAVVSAREIVDLEDLVPELDRLAGLAVGAGLAHRRGAELVLLRGALAALDGRARILTPAETAIDTTRLVTRTGGLGADLTMRDGVLRIVEPLAGGPGAKAGLLPGDQIRPKCTRAARTIPARLARATCWGRGFA